MEIHKSTVCFSESFEHLAPIPKPFSISVVITIRNAVSLGYPFLEALLHVMPVVDEVLIGDGGSTDSTVQYINRLIKVFPKVQLFATPWKKSEQWESFDKAIDFLIVQANGTWLWEIQSDEFWHEDDVVKLRKLAEQLHEDGHYNSIRQVCRSYTWQRRDSYEYRNIRILKKIPGLVSHWGGDDFQIGSCVSPRKGLTSHNVPPEYDNDIELYHVTRPFPKQHFAQDEVNVMFCGTAKRSNRWQTYERSKELHYSKRIVPPSDVIECLPALIKGLNQELEYKVRDKLFDKQWLEKTTGLKYT